MKIIFDIINQTSVFHLYYLIKNGIKKGEIYSGLAHVAEHTVLIPSCNATEYVGMGYTCIDHASVCFCSSSLDVLQEIDKKMSKGEFLTKENVMCAKHQVTHEIRNLSQDTQAKENIVKFVTDNRINKFAMGDIDEISRIQIGDVKKWFDDIKKRGDIYRFLFRDVKDISFSKNKICSNKYVRLDLAADIQDQFYKATTSDINVNLELYFRVSVFYGKIDFIKKALFEYCVQKKVLGTLGLEIFISEKYFDYDERFLVASFSIENICNIKEILKSIRKTICEISKSEFESFRSEFIKIIDTITNSEESNVDRINEIKNLILYDKPIIKKEDLTTIHTIEYSSFPIEYIVNKPLKIVIK